MTQLWPPLDNIRTSPLKLGPVPRIVGALGRVRPAFPLHLAGHRRIDNARLSVAYAPSAYPAILDSRHADGSFILIDGEIYNGAELYPGQPHLAAAILESYRRHGTAAFAALDMAASLILWDGRSEELYVVRDTMGHVPVFVAEQRGIVMFASDLPALMDAGVPRDMDMAALDFYLARGFVPAPLTFLKAARRIPPGTLIHANVDRPARFERYFERSGAPPLDLSIEDTIAEYAQLLPRAMERRLSGNTGLLLSGGVDSKTLLALATKVSGKPVPTFTFRYENYDGPFNESALARACADHFGAPHTEISVDPLAIAARLPEMIENFGEPFSYGLHSVMLGKVRECGVVNLLSGTGADGLHLLWQERNAQRVKEWPELVRTALGPVAAQLRDAPLIGARMSELHGALWSARTGLPYFVSAFLMPAQLRETLYADPALMGPARETWNRLRAEALAEYSGESDVTRYKFLTQRYYGAEMMDNWNHWAARAHGLTIRSVYEDRALVDRISRIPLTRPGKIELREYAAGLMPRDMAFAQKLPQSAPIEVWTRGVLRDFTMDSLSPARVKRSGLFAPKAVEQLLSRHMSGRKDYGWQLWSLISAMTWQDVFRSGPQVEQQ